MSSMEKIKESMRLERTKSGDGVAILNSVVQEDVSIDSTFEQKPGEYERESRSPLWKSIQGRRKSKCKALRWECACLLEEKPEGPRGLYWNKLCDPGPALIYLWVPSFPVCQCISLFCAEDTFPGFLRKRSHGTGIVWLLTPLHTHKHNHVTFILPASLSPQKRSLPFCSRFISRAPSLLVPHTHLLWALSVSGTGCQLLSPTSSNSFS